MTSLQLNEQDISSLEGKVALITGGSSGIGFGAAKIFASKGATVYLLDLNTPDEECPPGVTYLKCSTTSWTDLKAAFKTAGRVDIAVANAGVSEEADYFADTLDEAGELLEPAYNVLEVNYRGALNFIKLAISYMKAQKSTGSIVITASSTAYNPEQNLPVYSATKLALIGLVRSLRSTLPCHGITINAVAPNATETKLLPGHLAGPLRAAGLPVSTSEFVGLAVVYSATAEQSRWVQPYGKQEGYGAKGRWNGRVILTLGDQYTELEEKICDMQPLWFGWQNAVVSKQQQSTADFRNPVPAS